MRLQQLGWVMIGFGAVLLVFAAVVIFGGDASMADAVPMFVGVAAVLGLQMGFGVFLLRQSSTDEKP